MSKKPLISIITVNLNNLEGLKKTMTSVLEQSSNEYEYIIIDGGSTDGSREFIQIHDHKIQHWVSEPDKGIYNAMNKGIKAASGEYLLFLNSGDWLHNKNILSRVSPYLTDCDVLYGNMVKVFADGREYVDKGLNGKELCLKDFIEGTINHSSSFLKRRLFSKYGLYDEDLKIVSDWKHYLIALGLNNAVVSYLDYPFSYFNMEGISNSNLVLRNSERKAVILKEIPTPIYRDYLKIKEQEQLLNSPRMKNFLSTDNKKISRKLHSLIFRIFS